MIPEIVKNLFRKKNCEEMFVFVCNNFCEKFVSQLCVFAMFRLVDGENSRLFGNILQSWFCVYLCICVYRRSVLCVKSRAVFLNPTSVHHRSVFLCLSLCPLITCDRRLLFYVKFLPSVLYILCANLFVIWIHFFISSLGFDNTYGLRTLIKDCGNVPENGNRTGHAPGIFLWTWTNIIIFIYTGMVFSLTTFVVLFHIKYLFIAFLILVYSNVVSLINYLAKLFIWYYVLNLNLIISHTILSVITTLVVFICFLFLTFIITILLHIHVYMQIKFQILYIARNLVCFTYTDYLYTLMTVLLYILNKISIHKFKKKWI